MRGALVLIALLLTAGCITQPAATKPEGEAVLSEALFDKVLPEPLPFTAEDGTLLDVYVYRPDAGATGVKVPVIINYSPYWSNLSPPAAEGGDPFSQYLIAHFVERGYAVALVSVRGTGLSEGCFSIGGAQEIDDADAIATFLATQPWANGNVAAVAKSYDGTVAQGLLTRNNPHVRTIVPVSPISEFYKYNYVNGVPYEFGGLLFNTYYVVEVSAAQGAAEGSPTQPTYERTPTRICEESLRVQSSQYESAVLGDYTAYWQERNYTAQLPDEVTASVFYVHGLQDWNVKPDHMSPWLDALYARNVTLRLELGQWAHDYSHRSDWNATFLSWLDSELKGIDTGITRGPLARIQDTEGQWRLEERWPPARATPLTLYPSGDGTLATDAGTGSSAYADAPQGALGRLPAGPGAIRFDAAPAETGYRIAGMPELRATVSSTSPRATLAAALLFDGVVVDQGILDLAHRNGLESLEPLTPGETYEVVVPFYPQDIVVPAGSVVSLILSGMTPDGAPVAIAPFAAPGTVTVSHGEGTALTLPTLALDDVALEAEQPEDVGCWTC